MKTLMAVLLFAASVSAATIHVDLVHNGTVADIILTASEPVSIVGAQFGFVWEGDSTITGGSYVPSAIVTWPGSDWNADLGDGDATYAWISFDPLLLTTDPTTLGWVAFDGPSAFLDLIADGRPPTKIVSADSNPPDLNLWDGVETGVALPEPGTGLIMALFAGFGMLGRRHGSA